MSVLDGHPLAHEWDLERHVIEQLLFPDDVRPSNDGPKKRKKGEPAEDRNLCACGSKLVAVPSRRMKLGENEDGSAEPVSVWIKVCGRSFRTKRNCKYALAKEPIAWRLPSPPRTIDKDSPEPNPIPPVIRAEEALENKKRPCRRRTRLCPRR